MTDFTEDLRKMCRYSPCGAKLKTPVANPREAFCGPLCYSRFYKRHCRVCERPIEQPERGERKLCKKPKCRNEWAGKTGFGRFVSADDPSLRKSTQEVPDFIGVAEPPKGSRPGPTPWLQKGLQKAPRGLNPWRWVRVTGPDGEWREDDDWELFDRGGKMVARVRQEGTGYWLARPRITPEPPIESFEAACRRAVNVAMTTLASPETEKHPVHPGMTTSQFEATRRDLGNRHPDWSAKEVDRHIIGILKPSTRDGQCLIKRHDPPVNILGGYRFPNAPVMDLGPIEPEPKADVRVPSPPLVPTDDPLSIPDFLRRTQ